MKFLMLSLLLPGLSLGAQVDARAKASAQAVKSNPLYQDKGNQGVNPLYADTQRQIQGILIGLKPEVAAKVRSAAALLQASPALHGPEDAAWRAAQDAVQRTFGVNRPPDPLESLAVVVAGLAVTGKRIDKASPLLMKVSNVLKTKHDTVKNSINNVR